MAEEISSLRFLDFDEARMSGTRSRCCAIRSCENLEPCKSWLALVAVLLTNMLLNLADSFGVYYDALVDKYDASRAAVGWIFSIRWTFIFLAGITLLLLLLLLLLLFIDETKIATEFFLNITVY